MQEEDDHEDDKISYGEVHQQQMQKQELKKSGLRFLLATSKFFNSYDEID